jgi:hypothetical protein
MPVQGLTAWGAALSPDGEYWWDGTTWRPMYTPDRQHVWDGQAWLPADPAGAERPEAAVASADPARPNWLPRGSSLSHSPNTPARTPSSRTTPPEVPIAAGARPRKRGRLVEVGAMVLALVLGVVAAGAGFLYYQRASSAPAVVRPAGLAAVAAQPSELPAGVKPCPGLSFNERGYLAYLQQKHPDLYPAAQTNWSKSQGDGLLDVWFAPYSDDAAKCDAMVTGKGVDVNSRGLLNVVFLARDEASAAKVYRDSIISLPSFVSAHKGVSTGLGDNSTEAYAETGSFKSYLAIWSSGRYAALVSSGGLSQAEARRAVTSVNTRMH